MSIHKGSHSEHARYGRVSTCLYGYYLITSPSDRHKTRWNPTFAHSNAATLYTFSITPTAKKPNQLRPERVKRKAPCENLPCLSGSHPQIQGVVVQMVGAAAICWGCVRQADRHETFSLTPGIDRAPLLISHEKKPHSTHQSPNQFYPI